MIETLASAAGTLSDGSLLSPANMIALVTLTALEIVLGVDNIIVLSIIVGRLPEHQQGRARFIGLALAMLMRVVLLLGIKWIMELTRPWLSFSVPGLASMVELSGRDLILILGGLFLIWKSTKEIHHELEGPHGTSVRGGSSFARAIGVIILMDLVFSLDSVITAVGMVKRIEVMIAAVIIAVAVMMVFAGRISGFVHRHPSVKVLALSFLILVGVLLVADGFEAHISRGYVYFAMAFSLVVELVNIRVRQKQLARAGTTPGAPAGS